ncbi:Armc2, partial [Symbiodinium pilosum]
MMQAEEAAFLEIESSEDREVSSGRGRVAVLAGVIGAVLVIAVVGLAGVAISYRKDHSMLRAASTDALVQLAQESGALQALAPQENLHDSNPCADDEEIFEGLCYAKCSILSGGMRPVRCAAHICEPLDSNGHHKCRLSAAAISAILSSPSLFPCQGYDVAGTQEGAKRCPHTAGACLNDEELYLGTCFKKCSVLTNGVFPHRKAFATCCKTAEFFQCLMPGQSKTAQAFAEGGGAGDHDFVLQLSLFQVSQVYSMSAFFGYALQQAELRYSLEKAAGDAEAATLSDYVTKLDSKEVNLLSGGMSLEAQQAIKHQVAGLCGELDELWQELMSALSPQSGSEEELSKLRQAIANGEVESVPVSVSRLRHIALEGIAFGFLLSRAE